MIEIKNMLHKICILNDIFWVKKHICIYFFSIYHDFLSILKFLQFDYIYNDEFARNYLKETNIFKSKINC